MAVLFFPFWVYYISNISVDVLELICLYFGYYECKRCGMVNKDRLCHICYIQQLCNYYTELKSIQLLMPYLQQYYSFGIVGIKLHNIHVLEPSIYNYVSKLSRLSIDMFCDNYSIYNVCFRISCNIILNTYKFTEFYFYDKWITKRYCNNFYDFWPKLTNRHIRAVLLQYRILLEIFGLDHTDINYLIISTPINNIVLDTSRTILKEIHKNDYSFLLN